VASQVKLILIQVSGQYLCFFHFSSLLEPFINIQQGASWTNLKNITIVWFQLMVGQGYRQA